MTTRPSSTCRRAVVRPGAIRKRRPGGLARCTSSTRVPPGPYTCCAATTTPSKASVATDFLVETHLQGLHLPVSQLRGQPARLETVAALSPMRAHTTPLQRERAQLPATDTPERRARGCTPSDRQPTPQPPLSDHPAQDAIYRPESSSRSTSRVPEGDDATRRHGERATVGHGTWQPQMRLTLGKGSVYRRKWAAQEEWQPMT